MIEKEFHLVQIFLILASFYLLKLFYIYATNNNYFNNQKTLNIHSLSHI